MRKLVVVALFAPSVAFAATGSIDVQVQNAPGEIVLDGFPTDKRAPALLEQVPIGNHVVELEYGCMVGKADVAVAEGAKVVVKLPLQNRGGEGTLRLKGAPFNAEVIVDGAPISKADEGVKLPCGARRIEVSAPGFSTYSEVVVITTGKWSTIEPKLTEDMEEAAPPTRTTAKPDPAVSDLDEEEEEPRTTTRPPVRSEFETLDEELEDEQDPDAIDEDEMLDQESDEVLDEVGDTRSNPREDEDEDIRARPEEDEEDIRARPMDEEEEEEIRPPKEKNPFPARGVLTVGLGAVGAAGIGLGAASTPSYLNSKAAYDAVVAVNGPTDPQAIELLNGPVAQSKARMAGGFVFGGIGAVGATAAFLLIPGLNEKDAEDLVFSPAPTGFVVSGRF